MATTRVRTFVGRTRSTCALCGTDAEHRILETRNRRRFPLGDAGVRRYLICVSCGSRSVLTDSRSDVVDLRDPED